MASQAEREQMLEDAIAAVRAWQEARTLPPVYAGPYFPTDVRKPDPRVEQAAQAAAKAVTKAVTVGDHIHTLISIQVPCPGMRIVNLIDDRDARTKALLVERNAANRYLEEVKQAIRTEAVAQAAQGYGEISRVADVFGITRPTLYTWAAECGVELSQRANGKGE